MPSRINVLSGAIVCLLLSVGCHENDPGVVAEADHPSPPASDPMPMVMPMQAIDAGDTTMSAPVDAGSMIGPQDAGMRSAPDASSAPYDAGPAAQGEAMVAAMSDDFEESSLSAHWALLDSRNAADARVDSGRLILEMRSTALWYNAQNAPLLSKTINGNFRMTARVHAYRASDPRMPLVREVHLGGLMARDPDNRGPTPNENYVLIVLGRAYAPENSVETKTTVDSMSTWNSPAWPTTEAELRICRVGSSFNMYKRNLGATAWTLAMTYDRPDLPPTLQVGACAYASGSPTMPPDLRIEYDEITFSTVESVADCLL